ncbi:MAG: carboxypeptidase regulatory-like domain-containing protein [Woeseiaceae bacterium]
MNWFEAFKRTTRSILVVGAVAFAMGGCDGDDGASGAAGAAGSDGQDAVDTGTISVTVTTGGNPVEGATVTTDPATISVDTDAAGQAVLADVPIGVYDVTVAASGIQQTETSVNVAASLTTDVSFSVSGIPGTVTGMVLAPDGAAIEGATVSAPGSTDAVTDATGAFMIDAVVREFLSVTPPAGSTFLPGGTRESVTPGDDVEITLSGGPESDATFVSSDTCLLCHAGGLVDAWESSGHYRVIERSLIEMDMNGWPVDPGAGLCSAWLDTGVDANDPSEATSETPSHDAYIRTCNDDPDLRFEMLVDSNDDGADEATDTVVPVYATYGGPGTAAGEISELQDRGEATDIHGAWKQRYMFSIADLGSCSALNPEGTFTKNAKPAFITWDTTQTCEDMLMMPIQFNQRTLEWVAYHNHEWYGQHRAYSKKCSGCHEVGLTLTAVDGNVTQYAAVDYRIGCEKCHGPGSSHIAGGGDPNMIMNPDHMTADAAVEVCGQCHSRGSDPIDGTFGFPWRSDVADFDGNFVAGLHKLDWDAVDVPEGYFLQKPGNWPTGFPSKHRQQYNSYLKSSHIDNPYDKVACNDCHSPHSGRGGPFQFTNEDFAGNEFLFADNSNALMSNVRCLSCHASHGPFATLTLDDIAIYHTGRGGGVDKNGVALAPTPAEQTSAEDLVEQAVKAHSGEVAGMPLAPYLPENSHIPAEFELGEGPVGRCTSCHMTKTAKSGSWFKDADGRMIEGDNSNHSFEIVEIQANTDQPNSCGSCHASFRTKVEAAGGD